MEYCEEKNPVFYLLQNFATPLSLNIKWDIKIQILHLKKCSSALLIIVTYTLTKLANNTNMLKKSYHVMSNF